MFTAEQRAMADRLENYLGVRIREVADASLIESDSLRSSVLSSGRRSWFSKDGSVLYVYSRNLPDMEVPTLLGEVVSESAAQKGLDMFGSTALRNVLEGVWSVADRTDRLSVVYANRYPVSMVNNLGKEGSRIYLSMLSGKNPSRPAYEDVALVMLSQLYRDGFDLRGEKDYVDSLVSSLRVYNKYHPVPLCSLTESVDISANIRDTLERSRTASSEEVCRTKVSFGALSPVLQEATGFGGQELTMSLTHLLNCLGKYGIRTDSVTDFNLAERILQPMAVIGNKVKVDKRDASGNTVKDGYGKPITVQEDRFHLVTDFKVYDRENQCSVNLMVSLPSVKEYLTGMTDDIVIRGFSPKRDEGVLRSIENGELLYCDGRMLSYLEGLEEKERRLRNGAGPDALNPERKRLNYAANVVKDFLSDNRGKEKVSSEISEKPEMTSEVAVRGRFYSGPYPVRNVGALRSLDLKTRLERGIRPEDFSPSVYKNLIRLNLRCAQDLMMCSTKDLRPKDVKEIKAYLDRIGIVQSGRSESVSEVVSFRDSTPYRYLVENMAMYVVRDIDRVTPEDMVNFLSRYPFDRELMDAFVQDSYLASCEKYVDLTDEDREYVMNETRDVIRPDSVLEEIVARRLRGEGIDPDEVISINGNVFEAVFLDGDETGRNYIVNQTGEPLHDGYFLFDTTGKELGYEVDGNRLRGEVVDGGFVFDISIDLEKGVQVSRSKRI